MIGIGQAIILGVIEGLTEFIPVSSTGHLVLFGHFIGVTGEDAKLFDIVIQLGAILAVLVLYKDRFKYLLNFKESGAFIGINGILKLFLATLPALIVGFLLHDLIDQILLGSTLSVALALIFGGLVMIFVERFTKGTVKKATVSSTAPLVNAPRMRRQTTHKEGTCSLYKCLLCISHTRIERLEEVPTLICFLIGCFQCLSLWPGMSRSGSTIIGAYLLGLNRAVAAEISFLMAVPVMAAAVAFSVVKKWQVLLAMDLTPIALGFLVSFVTAVLAIKFFIALLTRWGLIPFGVYRIALGMLVLCW